MKQNPVSSPAYYKVFRVRSGKYQLHEAADHGKTYRVPIQVEINKCGI